jgi:hypothetical protein
VGRVTLVAILTCLAAPAFAVGAELAVPAIPYAPRSYICYRAEKPPAIDGTLDDLAWRAAPWTEPFVDIEGAARPTPRFDTRAKLLWDDTNLYIAAQLEEPDVWATLADRDAVIFHDNDFEVFIDPDGDTHEYYELEVNALGTVWDLLLIRPYRDGGPAVNGWDIRGLRSAVKVDGTLDDPRDRDRGWTVELAFPWDALRECAHRDAPPRDGDQWRVNFSRVEWRLDTAWPKYAERPVYVKRLDSATGKPLPEDNWVWSPQGLINMHYPEMWGVVQFAGEPAGRRAVGLRSDPDDAGRWALRRVYYAERRYRLGHGAFTASLAELAIPDLAATGIRLETTADAFEARVQGEGGRRALRIDQEGRVRPLEEPAE